MGPKTDSWDKPLINSPSKRNTPSIFSSRLKGVLTLVLCHRLEG